MILTRMFHIPESIQHTPPCRAPLLIEGFSAAWFEIPPIKRGGASRRGVSNGHCGV